MKKSLWDSSKARKIIIQTGVQAYRTVAERILSEGTTTEAPVETGTLRRSGTVSVGKLPDPEMVYEQAKKGVVQLSKDEVNSNAKKIPVYISYNTPYALKQHEEPMFYHPVGGKAKYLEDPFNRHKNKAERLANVKIKQALYKAK